MEPTLYLDKAKPAVFAGLAAVAKEVSAAAKRVGLSRQLIELINIRVSQLNGCAFCLDVHHRRALAAGEDPRRRAVLPAWGDSSLFTEAEQAALRLAESVTTVPDQQTRSGSSVRRDRCWERRPTPLSPGWR